MIPNDDEDSETPDLSHVPREDTHMMPTLEISLDVSILKYGKFITIWPSKNQLNSRALIPEKRGLAVQYCDL